MTDLLTGDSVGYDEVGDSRLLPGSEDGFVGGRPYGLQVVFAQDAIDGSPTRTPFGSTDLLVLWWWKEIALLALALGGWRWWLRRRRAQPRAVAATPASPAGS